MTKAGKVLALIGAVNIKRGRVRLLHPIVIIELPVWILIAVVVCLFSDESIQSAFLDNHCIW